MPTSELDSARAGEDAPMPISPLSPTLSRPTGLHINPEPGEDPYTVQSPSVYDPSENARRVSLPSESRQGSVSHQSNGFQPKNGQRWDSHVSDPQITDSVPYINRANRPVLNRRQSSTSPSNSTQNNERRDSNHESTQAESIRQNEPLVGNLISSAGQQRRTSLPLSMSRRESIPEETPRRDSNTQPLPNLGSTSSNSMDPIHELAIGTSEASSESLKHPWWRRRLSLANTQTDQKRTKWLYILFPLTFSLLIGLIVALVLYFKLKGKGVTEAAMPTPTILPQASVLPITDSSIGAAEVVIGTYFSTAASGVKQTKLVYNGGGGKICIRTKSVTDWLNVQCLEGANPRADTPLTVLDWLGGPSIYFVTADNFLSGIDHMPVNDTWKFSTLRDQKRPAHPRSQLASVTWFNGTSSWVYYQDINSQLREFGLDDYRDVVWRDGSTGPLGLALAGTGIGASRWWLGDGSEVLEVFVQVSGGALHGRVYMQSVWTSDFYAVDGTPNTVSEGATLTSTVIHQPNSTMMLLVYVSSDGYLTVQSRGTANETSTVFDDFTVPVKVLQGDGGHSTGIAAFDSEGRPIIYFAKGAHILEISAADVAAKNWSTFDVTAA